VAIRTHFDVDHTCGHTVEHDLSARPADKRAAFARWLAARECTDCWKTTRETEGPSTQEWLEARRAQEQAEARAWATRYDMPPLDGPPKTLDWGERSRHQLVVAAHTALVVEGTWGETDWTPVEEKARTITRAGWWIDQRDADGADLPELLEAATSNDIGTENPFR
jgi:hypothetical protein